MNCRSPKSGGMNQLLQKGSFVKQRGLRDGGWCSGFAAGDANDAKDGDFAESRARNKDAVGIGVEIRRGDLDAVVDERKEIVGYDAFQGFTIEKSKAEPQAIEFRTAEEGFALGLEVIIEIAYEVDRANLGEGQLLVLAILGEQVDGVELAEARGVQVTAKRLAVVQRDDDLFVGRGWGAEFQGTGFPLRETARFATKEIVCYVKREIPVNLLFLMDLRPGACL